MKRFALVLVLALLAVTSVFAVTGKTSTSVNVSLTLKNDMFAEERFGFTFGTDKGFIATDENMDDIPTDISRDIAVNYKNGVAKSESFGIYYKVRGAKPLTLTLGSCLYFSNTDNGKQIPFNLYVTDGNQRTKIESATDGWTKTINLSTDKIYDANLLPVEIETTGNIDASYICNTAYETLLVLQVKSI